MTPHAESRWTRFREHWQGGAIMAGATVLRLVALGAKPPHFDEGVNGWFLDQMAETGAYHYDPANYHGPFHFYLLYIFYALMGRTTWALRLPVALVSVLCVWLVLRFEAFLPRPLCRLAALAMALSPAMVFYGRYAIHETELAFFLLLFVWGAAGLVQLGARRCLWAVCIGAAGMICTKETCVIHLACFGLAAACLGLLERFSPTEAAGLAKQTWSWRDATAAIGVSAAIIVFFYSGCFLDWPSLGGLFRTFAEWAKTGAEGHGHEKNWSYWLTLLVRYEWPALIGLAWSVRYALPGSPRLLRFLAIYGCGALAAYSIVRYKTPWCVISLLWPFFFLFGGAVRELSSRLAAWVARHPGAEASPESTSRAVWGSCFLALAISLGVTIRLNFRHFTDNREPYVYVQTFEDIHRLVDPLLNAAAEDPAAFHLKGHLMLSSYHPLPWMLGDFSDIGYWSGEETPPDADADFLAVDESRADAIERRLKGRYFTDTMTLRDSQEPARLYFAEEPFARWFSDREPDFTPE
jgi:uncharacterized protein (TIGR03663 family)